MKDFPSVITQRRWGLSRGLPWEKFKQRPVMWLGCYRDSWKNEMMDWLLCHPWHWRCVICVFASSFSQCMVWLKSPSHRVQCTYQASQSGKLQRMTFENRWAWEHDIPRVICGQQNPAGGWLEPVRDTSQKLEKFSSKLLQQLLNSVWLSYPTGVLTFEVKVSHCLLWELGKERRMSLPGELSIMMNFQNTPVQGHYLYIAKTQREDIRIKRAPAQSHHFVTYCLLLWWGSPINRVTGNIVAFWDLFIVPYWLLTGVGKEWL